jgi:phosphohistidine swiveling domain-containing protein
MSADVDLLHVTEPNELLWSRTNFAEAMPGVLTPLSWSFWGPASEQTSRRVYVEKFGAFSANELTDALADQMTGLFYGRAAVNVDLVRRTLDRVPGADPDALELQILGAVRPEAVANPTLRRVPAVLARAPLNVALLPQRVRRLRADIDPWWRRSTTSDPTTVGAAGARIREAQRRFVDAATEHGFNVFVGQAAYDQLAKLAASAGHPGLELALAAAGDGTEETAIVEHLWDVVAGNRTLEQVAADHGYHGPDEGQISSRSWREDPAPLLALIERYQAIGSARPPGTQATRRQAVDQLLAACSPTQRIRARAVLRFADRHLSLREVGKAAFLQCIDVARHAAHTAGRHLVDQGRLETVDDVSYLSIDEIAADRFDPDAIERRRVRRVELLALDLPNSFVGIPDIWPRRDVEVTTDASEPVTGVPASPGRHTGVARVVRDPSDYHRVEDGDVLVCELTDPGWAPLLAIVGAAVIDIGGPLSHGAIVARELGIPCVMGTGDGTKRLVDGTVVTVDGDAGTVSPA